jgi:predicted transcriptional regulator
MTSELATIQVPQALYRRLERLAELTHRPVDSLVEQTLTSSLPPLPEDLPAAWGDALLALEGLRDAELEREMRATYPQEDYEQFAALREKQRGKGLTAIEQAGIERLAVEADLLGLRKAYAAALLKWRGQRVPTLPELEAS